MSDLKLKNCPFCNCTMSVRSNRDWHRPEGDHEDHCPVDDTVLMYPATDIGLSALVNCWNTRVTQPEATAPAQDLSAAILALPLDEQKQSTHDYGAGAYAEGFDDALAAAAALASSANALSAGDIENTPVFELLKRAIGVIALRDYDEAKAIAADARTILQSQNGGSDG